MSVLVANHNTLLISLLRSVRALITDGFAPPNGLSTCGSGTYALVAAERWADAAGLLPTIPRLSRSSLVTAEGYGVYTQSHFLPLEGTSRIAACRLWCRFTVFAGAKGGLYAWGQGRQYPRAGRGVEPLVPIGRQR
jgi:hypothetical protein